MRDAEAVQPISPPAEVKEPWGKKIPPVWQGCLTACWQEAMGTYSSD